MVQVCQDTIYYYIVAEGNNGINMINLNQEELPFLENFTVANLHIFMLYFTIKYLSCC